MKNVILAAICLSFTLFGFQLGNIAARNKYKADALRDQAIVVEAQDMTREAHAVAREAQAIALEWRRAAEACVGPFGTNNTIPVPTWTPQGTNLIVISNVAPQNLHIKIP